LRAPAADRLSELLVPAAHRLPSNAEYLAHLDVLAADPWETMTESRRTRALGVVHTAADRIGALPRDRAPG